MDDLAYQLKADIKHDHSAAVFDAMAQDPPLWKPDPRGELREEQVYSTLVESRGGRRVLLRISFWLETETHACRQDGTTLLFPSGGTDNATIGILHDAGPRLSEATGAKNYLTWGSVLDSAGKPRIPGRDVYAPRVQDVPISLEELGFHPAAVSDLVLRKYNGEDASATIRVGGVLLDLSNDTETPWVEGTPLKVKHMNILSGFLTSNGQIQTMDPASPNFRAYVVGKALGDALQVRSLKEPLPAGLTNAILSTEDQLNHVRAYLLDVDSCWVRRRMGVQPRRVEYLPSSRSLDTDQSTYDYYAASIAEIAKQISRRYEAAIQDVQTNLPASGFPESYVKECIRQMKLLRIAVLFPVVVWANYAETHKGAAADFIARVQTAFYQLNAWSRKWSPRGKVLGPTGDLHATYVICQAAQGACDLGGFPIVAEGDISADSLVGALYGENAIPAGVVIPLSQLQPYVAEPLWDGEDPGGVAISGVRKRDREPYGIVGDYTFRFVNDTGKDMPTMDWVVGPLPAAAAPEPSEEPPAKRRRGGSSGDLQGYEGVLGEWLQYVEAQGMDQDSDGYYIALTILAHSKEREPILYKVLEEEVLGYLPEDLWKTYGSKTPPPGSELLWDAFVAHINACNHAYAWDSPEWKPLWERDPEDISEESVVSGEYLKTEAALLEKFSPKTPARVASEPGDILTAPRTSPERSPEGTITGSPYSSAPPSPIASSLADSEGTVGLGRVAYLSSQKSRGTKTRRTYKHGTRRK